VRVMGVGEGCMSIRDLGLLQDVDSFCRPRCRLV
jgi:hypothetical protein